MDKIKTTRDTEFNFALDLPDAYFGSSKYPTLRYKEKHVLIRIN
jgi:hypothetical protein